MAIWILVLKFKNGFCKGEALGTILGRCFRNLECKIQNFVIMFLIYLHL